MASDQIKFCPQCATEVVTTIRRLKERQVCPACNYVHRVNPVPVVTAVVINAWGEVLLVKRGRNPGKGLWALPAGFPEKEDPSLEEAVIRETVEETKITPCRPRLFAAIKTGEEDNRVLLFYQFDPVDGQPEAGDDAAEARFFSYREIPWDQIAFPVHKQVLEHWFAWAQDDDTAERGREIDLAPRPVLTNFP